MKKLKLLILFLSLLSLTAQAQPKKVYPLDPELMDMALIYQGGLHRLDWTEEQITPYVVHTYADSTKSWFFDSYLFFEYVTYPTDGYGFGNKYGSKPATKTEWEWLLGRLFEKGKALDALNNVITKYKAEIGEPSFRHKIVIGLPVPCEGQTNWGSIDGTSLNFIFRSNQVTAASWYVDQVISRFAVANFSNLDLAGFYWVDETTAKCGDLPKDVASYIHSKNLKFYWIPYWNADGAFQWKDYDFDMAYYQPNHYFDKTIIDSRITDACRTARTYKMAVEMEFDSKALYNNTDSYYSRFQAYIDKFETNGVFEKSSIAYYSGTRGLLDFANSTAPEDHVLLDRMAKHVKDRHATSSIDEVTTAEELFAIGGVGEIVVSSNVENAVCYTIDGRIAAQGTGSISVPAGFYIVNDSQGHTVKLMVK